MPTHSGFSTGPGAVGREGERREETRGRREGRGRERERTRRMTEKLIGFNNTSVAGDYGKNSFREGLEVRKRESYIYILREKNLRMT